MYLRYRLFAGPAGPLARTVVFVALLGSAGAGRLRADETPPPYVVGIAKVDVTPDYPIRLNGFGGRRAESEGVSQRIWAKALAIRNAQQQQQPVVLVTLDSLGVPLTMVDEVAGRLKQQIGLPRENFVLTFSHSHCTPKVTGASDNIFGQAIPAEHLRHIERYTRELTEALERVSLDAIKNCQQPARLEWAVGKVGFARNRRTAGGPVDHDLPVLSVTSNDDKVLAVYVTYACHCVTLSHNKISGDWAGYAQELIERKFPGCMALTSIGTGSDSDPDSGVTGDKVDIAAAQGAQIADEAARLMAGPMRTVTGELRAVLSRTPLPLHEVSRESLQQLAAQGGAVGYNAQTQLDRLDRGEPLRTQIDYAIQSLLFGDDLAMVFLAGEVCADYGLRLKTELNRDRVWIHGYSNDFCAYIPSERLLKEGGYGGGAETPYFALPSTFQPGLEQKIIDEVKRQVPQSYHVKPGTQGVPPKSPEESLQCIATHPELRVELVVAEPLVDDPVVIDFGPDGRLWVAEMLNYTRHVDEEFQQTGRIKVLEDRDGDGRYDHASVFAEGLRFPTEVKVWRSGILVCDAPDILYFEDADGDGKAEIRRQLFTGFATHNPHGRVNSLRLGLDNWLYGSGGIFGGYIRSFSGQQVDITNRDFRMNPDTGEMQPVMGQTQQSRVRDDWGNWFGCDSGTLLRHYPLEDRYLRRNPLLAPPASAVYVPDYPNSQQLYPLGDVVTFELSGPAGRPTSACGLEIYRDDLLGSEYTGNSFTCEPVNQLIHRLVLSPKSTTFAGHRAEDEQTTEFLASTDRWFRPVQVRTGPDGGLWIVDMYRYVIEHPRWIPQDTLATLDTMAGTGMGRIYRVVPRDRPLRKVPRFDTMSTAELCRALDTPNGTQRDLVHHQLLWRGDRAAKDELLNIALHGKHPAGRLHALCVLDSLNESTVPALAPTLRDTHSQLRRHAIRLLEPLAAAGDEAALALLFEPARPWTEETDAKVLLQLASTLGQLQDRRAGELLGQLLLRAADDEYLLAGSLSSVHPGNIAPVMHAALQSTTPEAQRVLEPLVSMAARFGQPRTLTAVINAIHEHSQSEAGLDQQQWRTAASVVTAANKNEPLRAVLSESHTQLANLRQQAQRLVEDQDTAEPLRLAALQMLASLAASQAELLPQLADCIDPRNSLAVQQAAIEGLSDTGHKQVPQLLLSAWSSSSPTIRGDLTDALLSREAWLSTLLDGLESGVIKTADLDATRRSRLLASKDARQAQRAATLLQSTGSQDRLAAIEHFRPATQLPGSADRGRIVFTKTCANCHKLEGAGQSIGPDLAALTQKSPEYLLTAILDPSRDVDARYLNYAAGLVSGKTLTGMLAEETSTSITLVEQQDKRHVILRADVEQLQSTGKSLMPDGLEKDLSLQDMSDLITYVLASGPPPKTIEGNQPQVVVADEQGQLSLLASAARIFGGDITFEPPLQNIGMWHGQDDHVSWQIEVARSGQYDVLLDAACAAESAGNTLRIDGLGQPLLWKVEATGGWDTYRQPRIGSVTLAPGQYVVTVRPEGAMRRALVDLRGVYLVPGGQRLKLVGIQIAVLPDAPTDAPSIAHDILSDELPSSRRQQLIDEHPELAAQLVASMTADLPEDQGEEYRRIPWIWRVAIATGKRNVDDQILEMLDVSLPRTDEPLRDWQAVVIGGGIINGVSMTGPWPRPRIEQLLQGKPELAKRWQRSLQLAAAMANNVEVPRGTRYDALRMIALEDWQARGQQLLEYLAGDDEELQMGAVSGLADMDVPEATAALVKHVPRLGGNNRELALDGLLRSPQRIMALFDAIERGDVKVADLGETRLAQVREHADAEVRRRAAELE